MARQPCAQDPVKASVMAATVLAIRMARPALSAMSSQSFETSTPMHNGPATAERSVEADRRRATMAHLSQEGEGPLAQDCNSGWARPTVRAQDRKGRTTDRDCLRTRVPSRIDLAVLPAILTADAKPPKNSRSTRTIQTLKGALRSLDRFACARDDVAGTSP